MEKETLSGDEFRQVLSEYADIPEENWPQEPDAQDVATATTTGGVANV
jgi:hypothetical protein